jgi:hypothetical protein
MMTSSYGACSRATTIPCTSSKHGEQGEEYIEKLGNLCIGTNSFKFNQSSYCICGHVWSYTDFMSDASHEGASLCLPACARAFCDMPVTFV